MIDSERSVLASEQWESAPSGSAAAFAVIASGVVSLAAVIALLLL